MSTILIATLGEHPAVVPGMINVLQAHGKPLDMVHVIYPNVATDRHIPLGFQRLKEHLEARLPIQVEGVPLLFDDATTEQHSLNFLRAVDGLLAAHTNDTVYLSIAGGAKTPLSIIGCYGPVSSLRSWYLSPA